MATDPGGAPPAARRSVIPTILVVAAGLLAQALVLVSDHVIWDGWWANVDLGLPDAGLLTRQFTESGKPLEGWFLAPFRLVTSFEARVAAAKIAGVACWVGSFAAMRACLRRLARLDDAAATAIACLAATAPVYEVLGDISLAMYPAGVLLFWCGWLLLAESLDRRSLTAIGLRIGALALLFLSFNVNSLLVMHYAVAATFALLRWSDQPWRTLPSHVLRASARFADLLALPIVFWIWKAVFTPTSGFYADYNRPSFAPARLVAGLASLAADFLAPLVGELITGRALPVALAITAAVGWWLARSPAAPAMALRGDGRRLVACGVGLMLAAAIPYIAVGQPLLPHGWWSRTCLLLPLPIAMMLVGLLRGASHRLLPTRPRLWLAAVIGVGVLFVAACWRNTLTMQAYGAKQAAIRRDLRELIGAHAPAVIQLRDRFPIRGTNDFYPPSIWTFLAAAPNALPTTLVLQTDRSVGDRHLVGPDGQTTVQAGRLPITGTELERLIETATGMPDAMANVRRAGPQFLIVIGPANPGNDDGPTIGRQYLWRRWFAPSTLEAFVASLTASRIEPLPPITR